MILSKAIRYVFTGALAALVDLAVFRVLLALSTMARS